MYYQYKIFLHKYLIIYYYINNNIWFNPHYFKSLINTSMWLDNSVKKIYIINAY